MNARKHYRATIAIFSIATCAATACTPRATLPSEQFADPVAGIAAEFAAIQADGASATPVRTAKQRIAALRSLIAQARVARQVYADADHKSRATALLVEMEMAEAALFKATFVQTAP